jgi:2,4-dienoyl-CoA reductase (NADPH2)
VGVETALFLAEKGSMPADVVKFLLVNQAEDPETLYKMAVAGNTRIFVFEMMDKIGKDIGKSTKWGMLQDLGRCGIETMTSAAVTGISDTGVTFEQGGKSKALAVDTVVVAAGSVSHNPLEDLVRSMGIACETAGDAARVGTAFDAVHQGFAAANRI